MRTEVRAPLGFPRTIAFRWGAQIPPQYSGSEIIRIAVNKAFEGRFARGPRGFVPPEGGDRGGDAGSAVMAAPRRLVRLSVTMRTVTSEILDRARLRPEAEEQERLEVRFGLVEAAARVPEEARMRVDRMQRKARALNARVTRAMAPDLFRVAEETFERLGLEPSVELLIEKSTLINAGSYGMIEGSGVHLIELTTGAVKDLTEDELRCVLGHEIGHSAYGHAEFQGDVGLIYRDDDQLPGLLEARLRVLGRLQEFSADRAGALAVGNDIGIAAATALKVSTGLGPEDLRLDLGAYIEEVARLESFDIPNHLGLESHPLMALRIRALQIFASDPDDHAGVLALARMMDGEVRGESGIHERNLLLAGGLLAAYKSQDPDSEGGDDSLDDEREKLIELILPYSDDPEGLLAGIETPEQAAALFDASAAWIKGNLGPERFELMEDLMSVVLSDGESTEGEIEVLGQAASRLDVPFAWVEKQLAGPAERIARSLGEGPPRRFGLRRGPRTD